MPPFAQIGETNIEAVLQFCAGSKKTPPRMAPHRTQRNGRRRRRSHPVFWQGAVLYVPLDAGEGRVYGEEFDGLRPEPHGGRDPARPHDADTPLMPSSQVVTVTTKTGQKLTGPLRNEDAFTLEVQTEDGRYHMLARSDVTDVHYTEHSLMPRDYSTQLTPKELNDVVSFLMVASRAPRPDQMEGR